MEGRQVDGTSDRLPNLIIVRVGRHAEAATRYQEVVDHAGRNSFYGRMGQLGVVEANAQAKRYDQAISAAQALVSKRRSIV